MAAAKKQKPDSTDQPTSWLELLDAGGTALRRAAERVSRWVEDHQEGIEQIVEGFALMAAVQPRMEELWKRWGNSEWGYLVWNLDFINGFALMLLLDGPGDEATLDFLEAALSDPQFIEEARSKLAKAPLTEPQRKQLDAGLESVSEHRHEVAVPLMIVALEGAFMGEAERRELVQRAKQKMHFTETSGKKGAVKSVEQIFKPLGLNEHLVSFLQRQVYGGKGNQFRHGTALEGWRQKSLSLVIALTAWLDLMAESDSELLVKTFGRQDHAIKITAQQLERYRSKLKVLSVGDPTETAGSNPAAPIASKSAY